MSSTAAEEAIVFDCDGERLVGILHTGHTDADTAVLVIVGGPQYRAGSHRQFVHLGRAVSAAGYPVLRFDYRGMGDSSGVPRSFESVSEDIKAAIDALQERLPSVQRVVLWGLCDGASAALMYCDATGDARVSSVCALNPWVRSDASLATTQLKHYYTQRLLAPEFWAKLLSGKVAMGALREFLQKARVATDRGRELTAAEPAAPSGGNFQQRMARGWQRLGGRIVLILSGNDYTAKEFSEHAAADKTWRGLLAQRSLQRHELPEADHTLSSEPSRLAVERLTIDWLKTYSVSAEGSNA